MKALQKQRSRRSVQNSFSEKLRNIYNKIPVREPLCKVTDYKSITLLRSLHGRSSKKRKSKIPINIKHV